MLFLLLLLSWDPLVTLVLISKLWVPPSSKSSADLHCCSVLWRDLLHTHGKDSSGVVGSAGSVGTGLLSSPFSRFLPLIHPGPNGPSWGDDGTGTSRSASAWLASKPAGKSSCWTLVFQITHKSHFNNVNILIKTVQLDTSMPWRSIGNGMELHLLCLTKRSIRAWSLDGVAAWGYWGPMRETSVHQNLAAFSEFRCLAPKSFLGPLELHLILARFHHSISLAGRDRSTHCGTKLDRPSEVASRPGFRTVSEMAALTSEMFTWPKRRNLKAKTYYILWIFSRPKAWNLIGFGLEISNARGLR